MNTIFWFINRVLACLWLAAAVITLTGCAYNAATGQRQLNLYSESQEINLGRQADSEVAASYGLYSDSALQKYVQQLGTTIAKTSERPNLPWTFRVVDDPSVNAFAIPGGFIYITRGLMTHVDTEAELAGVIGHEIGHVTAQHSMHSMSTQQITQLGVAAGMMIEPKLQKFGEYVSAGLGLLFLKFSRDDEKQADRLGFRYMVRANYDPRQMVRTFELLNRLSGDSGGRLPEWMSTHPNPENRIANFQKEIDTLTRDLKTMSVNRDSYLDRIDGMIFGQNPREGFFTENRFYHPEMAFQFDFPAGWQTVNQKTAVAAVSANQDAVLQITIAQGSSPDAAAQAFFGQQGMQSSGVQSRTVNGLSTASGQFRAQTEDGAILQGRATFVSYKGNIYQILGYTPDASWPTYQSTITNSMATFKALTDDTILKMQPNRVKILKLTKGAGLQTLATQSKSPVSLETLALINQTTENAGFKTGDRVKMIVAP